MVKNSHRFFNNRECRYMPCHEGLDKSAFNCLFCYCPLYSLGRNCGGNFKYSGKKRIKNCEDCVLPHQPDYYDDINDMLVKQSEGVKSETNNQS